MPDLRGHRDPSSPVVLGRPALQTPHDRLFRRWKCRRSTSEKCYLKNWLKSMKFVINRDIITNRIISLLKMGIVTIPLSASIADPSTTSITTRPTKFGTFPRSATRTAEAPPILKIGIQNSSERECYCFLNCRRKNQEAFARLIDSNYDFRKLARYSHTCALLDRLGNFHFER